MSPGPRGTSLGIDFGTSNTIAVVRRADGSVRPLLFDGAPLMPSAVCADAEGGLLVGRDAVHAGRRHPERFEPNPKRLVDRPSTLLGAREYPVPDLIGAVLDAVADECRRVVGRPAQVTLTVPAEWGPARRRVVEEAAARAGLGQARLVPEPVAAATYYARALRHRTAVGSSIVVYDLGAGTFDASVVRRTENGFETVALDGRGDLGGLDIDAALVTHLGTTYGDREGWKRLVDPTTIEERRHFREFGDEVRDAKERLSRHQQSDIAIPLLDVEAHLTRTELERIALPLLERTVEVTRAVMRAAGLDAGGAGVFLVGGASRMPLVATLLHRALGVAPTVLDQPEVVVAEGSVLWNEADAVTFPIQRTPQPRAPRAAPAIVFTPRAEPAEPPKTEAERGRGRRIGRRVIAGFVAVDVLIIAALAWYFNVRDDGAGEANAGGGDTASSGAVFEATWSTGSTGDLAGQVGGAHDAAVTSLAAVETGEGTMLFSSDPNGSIKQWSVEDLELVRVFTIEDGVDRLLPTTGSDGEPMIVALDHYYNAYVWTPSTAEFASAGTSELAAEGEVDRVAVGVAGGIAYLCLLNDSSYEVYDLEARESGGLYSIPDGDGYANFYNSTGGGGSYAYIGVITVNSEPALEDVHADYAYSVGESAAVLGEAGVSGMRVVYQGESVYAMVFGSDQTAYFWDLDTYSSQALDTIPYETVNDKISDYHPDVLETGEGSALLYADDAGTAGLVFFDSGETLELAGAGSVQGLEDITVDGSRFAVTGDSGGNIRFWSLGL